MNQRVAALDFIASCLSVSDIDNDALRAAIVSEHLDWPTIINIANAQLIPATFWVALVERGLTDSVPNDVHDYLEEIHRLNLTRNKHLKAQAMEAISRLNNIGVEPILLKGGVTLFLPTYTDPSARIMTDLDILVPTERAKDCWNLLRRVLGYAPIDNNKVRVRAGLPYIDYARMHHLQPLHRPGDYGTLEIHRDLLPESIAQIIPTYSAWQQLEPIKANGIAFSVLTPTYRVLHNLLHSFCADRAYVRADIPLRSLYELTLTQRQYQASIDWAHIQHLMNQGGVLNHFHAALYLSHRLFSSPMPESVSPTLATVMHYARCRLQTRWGWTEALMDRILWFSARDICWRYQYSNDFMSITRGRLQLATEILRNKCNRLIFRWVGHE